MADEPKTVGGMKLSRKMLLQLFAEKQEQQEEEYEELEDQEVEETEEEVEEETEGLTQDKVDEIVKKRLKREQRKWQKELEKQFGTTDLSEARQYYEAGRAVTTASGKKPQEVLSRLKGQANTQTANNNPAPQNDDLRQEIEAIKNLVQDQREQEVREREESEAKKEFGKLYDQYEDEIEDKAEETGLSLTDAAAIVLRPHMKDHFEQQTVTKQQKKRKKRIDASDGSPGGSGGEDSLVEKLSPRQKTTARKMGISPDKYAKRLQERGELE